MKSKDLIAKERETIVANMHAAIKANDADAFALAFDQLTANAEDKILSEAHSIVQQIDSEILTSRGVHQLTSDEKKYWNKVSDAMKSTNPKQALSDLEVVMPETVIDSVFEDLREEHPLLARINLTSTNGLIKMLINANGENKATWGKLTTAIVTELMSGFKEVDATLCKLSAFIPVSKDMLDLGPEWLDRYVRDILVEALAVGLEEGIVAGTGKDMPIGMIKDVSDDVTVTGGVYPDKSKVVVTALDTKQMGALAAKIAKTRNNKTRKIEDLILVVNPNDYYTKVMPATTLLAPDGTYRSDVLPIKCDIIQSAAVPANCAVFGMAKKYFCGAGGSKDGKIEYSDEYKFLEDQRVYLVKLQANGFALDNNAFIYLDITNLKELAVLVRTITDEKPANVSNFSAPIDVDATQTDGETAEQTDGETAEQTDGETVAQG